MRLPLSNSIELYLEILEMRKGAIKEYDILLWHGMMEFVTVYGKNDIRL